MTLLVAGQWYRAQLVDQPKGVVPELIPQELRDELAVKVSANGLAFSTVGGVYRLLSTNIDVKSPQGTSPLAITTADVTILGRCDSEPKRHLVVADVAELTGG